MENNASERELRREAVGRKNWLFVGSDDGGEVNATFVTLLASCQLHKLEPWTYLRDLFCLLPSWPQRRVLELAPAYWNKTLEDQETQQQLVANVFRKVTLGPLRQHRDNKWHRLPPKSATRSTERVPASRSPGARPHARARSGVPC